MSKIGLFGGSFNPPHEGHLRCLEEVCNKVDFDEIWILPQGHHRFKKMDISIEHIVSMCFKIFPKNIGDTKIEISFYDITTTSFSGSTYKLVNFLKRRYPEHSFHIIIGSDCATEIRSWDNWEKLLEKNEFVIIEKKKYHGWAFSKHWSNNKPIIISRDYIKFTSSQFREALKHIPRDVLEYIFENKLYLEEKT